MRQGNLKCEQRLHSDEDQSPRIYSIIKAAGHMKFDQGPHLTCGMDLGHPCPKPWRMLCTVNLFDESVVRGRERKAKNGLEGQYQEGSEKV